MIRNLGVFASLLVLAACGEQVEAPGHAETKRTAPSPVNANEPAIQGALAAGPSDTPSGDCSGRRIGQPLVLTLGSQTIRQLGGLQQEVTRNVTRTGSNTRNPPPLRDNILFPTNLDLQANSLGEAMGTNDYVEIEIRVVSPNLGQRDLIFLRSTKAVDPGDQDDPIAAVTVRAGAGKIFCFLGPIKRAGNVETVRLGSKLTADQQSSINIGLQIANLRNGRFSTPIYIDPNVRNEG